MGRTQMSDMGAERGTVVFVGFPVLLFTAAEEQWDALLREYALRGFGAAEQPYGPEDITRAGSVLAGIRSALADAVPGRHPDERTESTDITLATEFAQRADFALLQAILDDARRLAQIGELLTFPPLPEVAALRDWICDEVAAQTAGAAPTRWEFVPRTDDATSVAARWDRRIAPPEDQPWIVGDDHNRIVAVSPAALLLLGWDEADLVGQRILAVIPPRMRERHVAGFTRSVVTGDDRLLGTPLPLPALARDGREIAIDLFLSRHTAASGRTVYLARLTPVERPADATDVADPDVG